MCKFIFRDFLQRRGIQRNRKDCLLLRTQFAKRILVKLSHVISECPKNPDVHRITVAKCSFTPRRKGPKCGKLYSTSRKSSKFTFFWWGDPRFVVKHFCGHPDRSALLMYTGQDVKVHKALHVICQMHTCIYVCFGQRKSFHLGGGATWY